MKKRVVMATCRVVLINERYRMWLLIFGVYLYGLYPQLLISVLVVQFLSTAFWAVCLFETVFSSKLNAHKVRKSLLKKKIVAFIVIINLVGLLLPSKQTLLLMLGVYGTSVAVEQVSDTKLFKKSVEVLENELDRIIEDQTAKKED